MIEGQIRGNKVEFYFTSSRPLYTPLSKKKLQEEWGQVRQQVCCRAHCLLSGGRWWGQPHVCPALAWLWGRGAGHPPSCSPSSVVDVRTGQEQLKAIAGVAHQPVGARWAASAARSPFWGASWVGTGWWQEELQRAELSMDPRATRWCGTTGSLRLLAVLPSASRAFPEST